MSQQSQPSSRALLGRIVKWSFYAVVAGAFGWFLVTVQWGDLRGVHVRWWLVLLAIIAGLAFRFYGVLVWRTVLASLGATSFPPLPVLADVYARAWMGRYIPGKVAWLAGKVLLASEYGIAKSRLAVSSLIEAASQVVGIGLVSLVLLAVDGRVNEVSASLRVAAVVGAVALMVLIVPPVFNRVVALVFRVIRRGTPIPMGWRGVLVAVAMYAAGSVVSGLSNAFLAYAVVDDLGLGDLAFLIGAFGFAAVLGMIAPFAPGGLGVRDGAQLLLLLIVLPRPEAALVVLVARVWSAVGDLLFWGSAAGGRRLSSRSRDTLKP